MKADSYEAIAEALRATLTSGNWGGLDAEPQNIVDALFCIANRIAGLAEAVNSLQQPWRRP